MLNLRKDFFERFTRAGESKPYVSGGRFNLDGLPKDTDFTIYTSTG